MWPSAPKGSRAETGLAQNLDKKAFSTGCTLNIFDGHLFSALRPELYLSLVRSRVQSWPNTKLFAAESMQALCVFSC